MKSFEERNQCLEEENTDLVLKTQDLEESNIKIIEENTNLIAIIYLLQEESRGVEQTVPMAVAELQLLEYVKRTDQLEQEIGNLYNQKQQLRQEMENQIQRLLEENIQQNNDIQRHAQLEKDLIEKEKQQLQEAKNSMESQIQQLREDEIRMKNAIRKKDNDIRQLHQEKDLIEEEKHQLQELKSSMKIQMDNQIQQLRQEKNHMEYEYQQLRETSRKKDNEIQKLNENNRNLTNEIQQLQKDNDNMSRELQSLGQENRLMEIEIKQLQENTKCDSITKLGTVTFSTDDILGKGGWATVYKGNFYGTKVAVKEFYEVILSAHNWKILEREVNIASQCRHPNLLQMICATKNEKNCLLIVTELMDMALRTLLEQRANENSRLELSQIKSISLDVARGLNYLHLKTPHTIIHRDVSSANVLLCMENGSVRRAKISDYGSANFMQACNTECPGAELYAAPEAKKAKHSPKVSILLCILRRK